MDGLRIRGGADGVGDFVRTRPVGIDRGLEGIAGCNAALTADDLAGSAVEIDTRKIDPVSIEGTTRSRAGWNAMNRGVIF